jgi:hypothetical protein
MPAPPNDLFANAIILPGSENGYVTGNNNEATSEPFEFLNNGRTVWYRWQPQTTKSFYWNTRWNGGILEQQTEFAAVVDIFDVSLNHIVRGVPNVFSYERRVRVQLDATALTTYYIRIDSDGSQKTGKFLLWWEAVSELNAYDCQSCPPTNEIGSKLLACFTLSVFAEQTIIVPETGAGRYVMRYCGGAWNYGNPSNPNNSWVVGRAPQSADQSWAGQDKPGYFLAVKYRIGIGPQIAVYPEPVPPGTGYGSPGAAAAAVGGCTQLEIQHNGLTPMVVHFTDELYADNTLTDPAATPRFEIIKAIPYFLPDVACGAYDPNDPDPITNQVYLIVFEVSSYGEFKFTQLRPSITGAGITQIGLADLVDIAPNTTVLVRVHAKVTQLNTLATLKFTGPSGDFVQYPQLVFDISPKPDLKCSGINKVAGPDWVGEFQAFSGCTPGQLDSILGGLPTRNLVAIFEESGGVSNIRNRLGTPTNTIPIDHPPLGSGDFGGTFGIRFTPTPAGITSVTFTITPKDLDSGITYPPFRFTRPCPA